MSTENLIEVDRQPGEQEHVELQVFGDDGGSLNDFPSQQTTPSIQLSKRNSSEQSLPLRSYIKWSPAEQGATLVWRDLCVYTNVSGSGRNMKRIINNSTGAVQPGGLMALMGASAVAPGKRRSCQLLHIAKQ